MCEATDQVAAKCLALADEVLTPPYTTVEAIRDAERTVDAVRLAKANEVSLGRVEVQQEIAQVMNPRTTGGAPPESSAAAASMVTADEEGGPALAGLSREGGAPSLADSPEEAEGTFRLPCFGSPEPEDEPELPEDPYGGVRLGDVDPETVDWDENDLWAAVSETT